MKSLMVLLVTVAVSVSADCDVCLHQKCLEPAMFFDNTNVLSAGRPSISYNENMMYYKYGGRLAVGIAADVVTGVVFYYKSEGNKVYKYDFEEDETSVIYVPEPDTQTLNPFPKYNKIWAYNGKLYFNRKNDSFYKLIVENGLNFVSGPTVQRVKRLEDINVKDIVFAESGNMYFTDNEKIYKLKTNQELKVLDAPVTSDEFQISGSENGDLYMFDTKKNLIYMLDPVTEKFDQVGGFLNLKYVNYASLDKNNNIIFGNFPYYFIIKQLLIDVLFRLKMVRIIG